MPHSVEADLAYARPSAKPPPAFNRTNGIHFVERLLVWAGMVSVAIGVKVVGAVLDILTEASAEFGEWAIAPFVKRGRRVSPHEGKAL